MKLQIQNGETMQDVGPITRCQTEVAQNVTLTTCIAVRPSAGVAKQTVTALVLSVWITGGQEVGFGIHNMLYRCNVISIEVKN